ncbi:hypothetical protein KR009_007379, partial [Drosophila setifemur]
ESTMSGEDVPALCSVNMPSAVQFNAKKDFHTKTHQHELDQTFLGNDRRPWVQKRVQKDTRREREVLNALLATTAGTDYDSNCVDKLITENISYSDLASLTNEDLQLFGFKYPQQRQELLEMFAKMPNQDPSYDSICQDPGARSYNNQILGNAGNHFMSLRASLSATNYKLQVMPPEDVVVGDKRYASRFALETLKNVKLITEDIAKDLRKIEANAQNQWKKDEILAKDETNKKKYKLATFVYVTALAVGFSCAWFWWWTKFHSAPRLSRISVQT